MVDKSVEVVAPSTEEIESVGLFFAPQRSDYADHDGRRSLGEINASGNLGLPGEVCLISPMSPNGQVDRLGLLRRCRFGGFESINKRRGFNFVKSQTAQRQPTRTGRAFCLDPAALAAGPRRRDGVPVHRW